MYRVLVEVIGFLARAGCHFRTDSLSLFAIESVFILIAPALFAASLYMVLSHLMRRLHAERLSIIHARWLTKLFVLGDVLSFLIQGGGGGLATNQDINPDIPKVIVIVGLVIQVVMFGLFMVTTVIFHRRMNRSLPEKGAHFNWVGILMMLYVVSALIMVRSIYRIFEYAMGLHSYLWKHEWPTYVLDGGPMLVTMCVYGFWYPLEVSRKAIMSDSVDDVPLHAPVPNSSGYEPAGPVPNMGYASTGYAPPAGYAPGGYVPANNTAYDPAHNTAYDPYR